MHRSKDILEYLADQLKDKCEYCDINATIDRHTEYANNGHHVKTISVAFNGIVIRIGLDESELNMRLWCWDNKNWMQKRVDYMHNKTYSLYEPSSIESIQGDIIEFFHSSSCDIFSTK